VIPSNRTEDEEALRKLLDMHTDLDAVLQQYKERRATLAGAGGGETHELAQDTAGPTGCAPNPSLLAGALPSFFFPRLFICAAEQAAQASRGVNPEPPTPNPKPQTLNPKP